MPKRRSIERGGGPIPKERPMRRHLYLVLDDWSRGYTIRKIDLLPNPVASYPSQQIITGGFLGKQRLPPPIVRVEAARGLPKHLVASGRHLMFMQPGKLWEGSTFGLVPILDIAMRSTIFCRLPIDFLDRPVRYPDDSIYMAAGGSIYILDRDGFFVLTPASTSDHLCCSPSPADFQQLNMLPSPPFERKHVISYTHYADSLFFMSRLNGDVFLFVFNLMEGRWWSQSAILPRFNQMHFDPVLDAFVGLCTYRGNSGHIWLTYMDGSTKLSKEKLFSKADPADIPVEKQDIQAEKQLGCTLVYMGGRSNFCLVECISHDQTKCNNKDVSVHSCSLFRLTPFFLKYDKNGDLRIVKLQVQYYSVPQGVTESALNNPAAFWM